MITTPKGDEVTLDEGVGVNGLVVEAGSEGREQDGSLDALREMNDGLQHDVDALVTRKEVEAATANPPSKDQYPIHSRLKEIEVVICETEGIDEKLTAIKVPEKQKGDFSIVIPGLKEPKDGEDRRVAIQRYREVDLPRIAANLSVRLPDMEFSVVGMYLNVSFKRAEFVGDVFSMVGSLGKDFGNSDANKGRRVVLDYSSPNTAKTMHVGHLRSTVIGEILNRLMAATGAITYGINHIGDWGTQFGQLVVACELWGEEVKAEIDPEAEPVGYLSRLYAKVKGAIKDEETNGSTDLADRSRARFAGLERGDPEAVKMWQEFRRLSLVEFERMYQRLDIRGLNLALGESFYEDKMAAPEQDAIDQGLVEKVQSGAMILKFNTPVDLRKAIEAGLLEYSEGAGELVLKPNSSNVSGLEDLNKGVLGRDLEISCFWKVSPAALERLGMTAPKGKKSVTIKAVGTLTLEDVLVQKLITRDEAGEYKQAEEGSKSITLSLARMVGLLKQVGGEDKLIFEDLPSCVFRASDGRSVYVTRDAAALRHRKEHFKATDVLYVVGNEQRLHLSQLFEMSRRIGDIKGDEPQHVPFGMMKAVQAGGGSAKISSREGAGGLGEFLDELATAAEGIVRKREELVSTSTEAEIRKIAEQIAVGALVFANVSQDIARDIKFDPEAMMKFEGQTGPYIQYTSVRLNSLLAKSGFDASADSPVNLEGVEIKDGEYKLVKMLAEFVDVVESSANKKSPHFLAEYLLRLCAEFNNLYTSGPKLKDLDDKNKKYYLGLYKAVSVVMQRGMELLNIPIPKKM